ncbi:hypothetical protein L6164_030365 [Bauhinia variegata]|uniref:Uncharacterized protein n=1 Tax=Bauhinia variegata TaxID=167791 RepID=A0ACB9LCH6_BAUVA|nr:hypothetical protein L6164_030365 [Bauhinia variegata]
MKLESLLELGFLAGFDCNIENGQKQASEWVKPEGNLHLGTRLEFQQNQERVADLVNGVSSSISPIKVTGDMQPAGSPSKMMAPSTPIEANSASVSFIYIYESDDEPNVTQLPITDAQGRVSVSGKEKISQKI